MRIPLVVCCTLGLFLPTARSIAGPIDMDYGPFLAATYQTQWPQGNVVFKGVAVRFHAPIDGEPLPEGPIGGGNFTRCSSKAGDVDEVHRTQRTNFGGYQLNVPNGKYRVTLQFCESREPPKNGKRTFDILLQSKKVLGPTRSDRPGRPRQAARPGL